MAELNRDLMREINQDLYCREAVGAAHVSSRDVRAGPDNFADASLGHLTHLVSTIETEIIPRLMLAHQFEAKQPPPGQGLRNPAYVLDADAFASDLLAMDESRAARHIADARANGFALEDLYLSLMAPAARRLGELWEEDLCSFSEVTVALSRLHRMLLELGPAFHRPDAASEAGRRALLVAAPGEQHTFGLFMLTEFFRREGWEVWGEPIRSVGDLASAVHEVWFELVGLSAGTSRRLEDVRDAVSAVRRASRNDAVVIMVGGPLFLNHPEYMSRVGADATASDGHDALEMAESLVSRARCRAAGGSGA